MKFLQKFKKMLQGLFNSERPTNIEVEPVSEEYFDRQVTPEAEVAKDVTAVQTEVKVVVSNSSETSSAENYDFDARRSNDISVEVKTRVADAATTKVTITVEQSSCAETSTNVSVVTGERKPPEKRTYYMDRFSPYLYGEGAIVSTARGNGLLDHADLESITSEMVDDATRYYDEYLTEGMADQFAPTQEQIRIYRALCHRCAYHGIDCDCLVHPETYREYKVANRSLRRRLSVRVAKKALQ